MARTGGAGIACEDRSVLTLNFMGGSFGMRVSLGLLAVAKGRGGSRPFRSGFDPVGFCWVESGKDARNKEDCQLDKVFCATV